MRMSLGGKLRQCSDPLTLRRCGKRMTEDAPDAAAVAAVGDCTRGGNDGESGWREGGREEGDSLSESPSLPKDHP